MNYSDVVDGSEESSDESDEDPAEETEKVRQKRVACWRPRPTASTSADQGWPPDSSKQDAWPPWKNLRPIAHGNPTYGPRMQLFSSTGWNLAIYANKIVRGTQDDSDRCGYLELSYAGIPGHVRIQCMENKLYLGMNKNGRLYGENEKSEECTVFIESLAGLYNVYLSRHYAHLGWYVGLKKSGKVKKGPKTALNQKACKFLPRRSNIRI